MNKDILNRKCIECF